MFNEHVDVNWWTNWERGHSHLKKLKEYVTDSIKEQISIC